MIDFISFAESHGLIINGLVSGRWVRVPTIDHPKKRNGAYFYDGEYAHVQNWATMDSAVTWFSEKPITDYDRDLQARRIEEKKKRYIEQKNEEQKRAAEKAKWIISQTIMEQHAYLDLKGFPDEKGLVWRPDETTNLLVIPMRVGGSIVGAQLIDRKGNKRFLKGQRCIGAEFVFDSKGVDVWCEGYATALSVKKCMKGRYRIHVCFNVGNLKKMAKQGYVIADNDESLTGEDAAKETGLPYYLPPDIGDDFNDFHKKVGDFKASQALRKLFSEMAE